jgi:hypothetical protein
VRAVIMPLVVWLALISGLEAEDCTDPFALLPNGHKVPDGCSSWSNNQQQVRDSWGPINFRPACDNHDRCYYTYGTSAETCNRKFAEELAAACDNGTKGCIEIQVPDNFCIPKCHYHKERFCSNAEPTFELCLAFAAGMATAVTVTAPQFFADAQKAQKAHLDACRAVSHKDDGDGGPHDGDGGPHDGDGGPQHGGSAFKSISVLHNIGANTRLPIR